MNMAGQNNTQLGRPTPQQVKVMSDFIASPRNKDRLASVLPKHMTPERVVKIALLAISRQPKLATCTQDSVLMSLMQSSEMGLEPGGAMGHGYLVPYFNGKRKQMECQFIPGYRGLIALARRSKAVTSIEAHVVREGDTFRMEWGLGQRLVHIPNLKQGRGDITAAYAIARCKDADPIYEVMTREEIDAVRARSKSSNEGPWVTDYSEMARKTVCRRLIKYLPLSSEEPLARGMEAESDQDEPGSAVEMDFTPDPAPAATTRGDVIDADQVNQADDGPGYDEVVEPQGQQAEPAAPAGGPTPWEKLVADAADLWGCPFEVAANRIRESCAKLGKGNIEGLGEKGLGDLKALIISKAIKLG
jgi:recombination protein RecT